MTDLLNQVRSHRQCKYVRPLYMGLTEEAEAGQIAEQLNNLVKAGNYRI